MAFRDRIIALNPDEEADLVILYIKSGEIDQAVSLLKKLDAENKVPEGLIALKESLLQQGDARFCGRCAFPQSNRIHQPK